MVKKMVSSRFLMVFSLTVVIFASTCISAFASDNLDWGVERIRTQCVWDNNPMDKTIDNPERNAGQWISIAVIDTGIDYWIDQWGGKHYHFDLSANVLGGRGFRHYPGCYVVEEDDHLDYWDGHGTHIVGTIAAVDNDIGLIGAAPRANIYALKAVGGSPEGRAKAIAAAINWSVQHSVKIIVLSWDFREDFAVLREACDNAYYNNNCLLIACSGNSDPAYSSVSYPAAYDSVIAVGAVDENSDRPSWSNYGEKLEFVAPGVDINSTGLNGGYYADSGTSFAVPHVVGVAALIWNSKVDPEYDNDPQNGYWDNTEVRMKLRHFALDLGSEGWDEEYGYGLINGWATNQRPLGDLNLDETVDIFDVSTVGLAFGSVPGDPNWTPIADIDINNIVDIFDLMIVTTHFGEVDP